MLQWAQAVWPKKGIYQMRGQRKIVPTDEETELLIIVIATVQVYTAL